MALFAKKRPEKASDTEEKKAKQKKKKGRHPVVIELEGLVLLIVTFVLLTCMMFPSGRIDGYIRTVLFGIFGSVGAIALTLFIALILLFGRKLRENRVIKAKMFFAVLTVFSMTGALYIGTIGVPGDKIIFKFIEELWVQGGDRVGGGIVGGSIAWLVARLVGKRLALTLLVSVAAFSFTLAVGSTAWGLWVFIADILGISPTKRRKKKSKGDNKAPPIITMEEIAKIRAASIGADAVSSSPAAEGAKGKAEQSYNYTEQGEDEEEIYSVSDTSHIRATETASEIVSSQPSAEIRGTPSYAANAAGRTAYEPIRIEEPMDRKEKNAYTEPIVAEENDYADDGDDPDGDPFADQPERKERLMTKLFKKDTKMKELIREDNTAARAASAEAVTAVGKGQPAPQAEPLDDGVKRWTPGDKYAFPSTELLNPIAAKKTISEEEINAVAEKILRKLASFKVSASLVGYSVGPSITRYELAPGEGVRVSKISQLITDLSLELASEGVRIEAPIPGKSAVGIEVPNKKVSIVSFRSLVESSEFMKAKSKITVCVGQNVTGDAVFMDIDDMPHVLIAGQTKSGKSVAINCMLLSLLYRVTPDEVKLILVDPKRVELNIYGRLPHLIAPVVDEPTKAAAVLSWAVKEMERRYDLMGKYSARNRDEYRKRIAGKSDAEDFPQIVIVIDELADLMLQVKEHVEPLINRLAAKARACGIHLLIGTQRPSVDVLTGLIKANIPARISFKVAEQVDSRTIIGSAGAEKLLGRGDMLYQPTGSARVRIQGAYVDGEEINRVVDYIVDNNGEARYDPDIIAQIDEEAKNLLPTKKRGGAVEDDEPFDREKKLDPLFYNAVEIAVQNQSVSTSSLQRYLEIGYGRAAKLIDTMEKMGIAGPPNGSKPRAIFMDMDQYQVWRLDQRFD